MMTYSIALPAVVLFSLNQSRAYAAFGALVQLILLFALIIPDQKVFLRNVSTYIAETRSASHVSRWFTVSFFIFMVIFITVHYLQEKINRRTVGRTCNILGRV